MIRRLAHEPLGWRPTVLEVVVRRYRCADCGHVWRQDTSAAAEPRAKLSRTGLRWALEGIVVAHLTVARVAEGLGVAWDTHTTWTYEHLRPGIFEWTSPHGHHYLRDHHGTTALDPPDPPDHFPRVEQIEPPPDIPGPRRP